MQQMSALADPTEAKAPDSMVSTTEPVSEKNAGTDSVRPIALWQRVLLYTCICIGMFLSLLDSSIVATALYSIGTDFGALDRVTWVALAYTLAYVGCAVPFASLSNVIGRRKAYVLAFLIFFAFSLAAGWAQSLNQLIAFRAIQGIGGAGLYSLTMVIFFDITPTDQNAMIGAMAGLVVALGGIAGPILGGVITHYATWRWVFWINAPLAVPAMCVFALTWPAPDQLRGSQTRHGWGQLDFIGGLLIIAASVLTVFAFQQAGIDPSSWAHAIFLAPLLAGCLCWALLLAWQWSVHRYWRHRIEAVLPWHLLTQRVWLGIAGYAMVMGFPYLLVVYNLPLRSQAVNGASSLLAGVWLLPLLGSTAVGSTLAGMLNSKRLYATQTLVVATCFLTLGCGLMTTLDVTDTAQPKMFGFEVFVGLGFGLAVATTSMATGLETRLRDNAVAQGVVAELRVLGGSIGIAASTAILGTTEQRDLAGVVSLSQASSRSNLTQAQMLAVRTSYADSFTLDLKVCTAVAALTLFAALATYRAGPARGVVDLRNAQLREEEERRRSLGEGRNEYGPGDKGDGSAGTV